MTESYEEKINRLIKRYDPKRQGSEWDIIHADIDRKCNKFRPHFIGEVKDDENE